MTQINCLLLCITVAVIFSHCRSGRLAASAKNQPVSFFVLGDWGNKGDGYQLPVAAEMLRRSRLNNPAFILTVGDNFYENGVQSVNDEHWRLSYENVYKELTKKYSWYAALGNHDYRGSVEAQIDYHKVNSNWNMPGRYYTFVKDLPGKKQVRIIVIDTDPYITSYYSDSQYKAKVHAQDTAKQTRWVDSVLASSKEDWKIVAGHHPLYCVSAKPADTSVLIHAMEPLFKKYHVQAYICGHDHVMQYNIPEQGSVGYIISGGGARPLKAALKARYTLFASNSPSFTVCTFSDNKLNFKFIDTTGNVIYQNTVFK